MPSQRNSRDTRAALAVDRSGNQVGMLVSPYPSPELVKQYAELQPDAADRILRIVEKEQDADISQQRSAESHDFALKMVGLVFAALLCLAALAGGVLLMLRGHVASGWVSLVGSLVLVLTTLAKGGRQ